MDPLSCGWDNAKFLFFSDNVFDPLIYYSHLGPVILSLALLLLIYFGNRKELTNKILMFLIVFYCIWALSDLILWATEKSELIMFFWSSMMFFELLVYVTAFYFLHVFVHQRDLKYWWKILISLTFVPLLFFVATPYGLKYFDLTNCDREAVEGMLWSYTYVVEGFFIFLVFVETVFGLVKARKGGSLNRTLLVASGVILFLVAFSWGNIAGSISEDWSIGQYGLFGLPIFIGFLVYANVKYQVLNVKVIAAQLLVVAISILIGSQFFFIRTPLNRVLTSITLILVVCFGIMLIHSVKNEIKRKEELQKISDALAIANQRLKELDLTKSEFISIASHQLRTPLTAIKGYISLLLEGSYGEVSATVQDILNKVYTVNSRLVHLVEDLLNVSRIEAGRIQYSFAPTQLEPLVAELVEMFTPTAKQKNLFLKMQLAKKSLPQLTIDPNKIKEVLSNLIDNAFKYTRKGGVTVSLEGTPNVARITVTDTGIGIRPEDKKNLFEKFTRSKETTKMVASGAGLGLYVGKNFVEAHGGRLFAESVGAGKGSRFIIELPLLNPNIHIGTSDQPSQKTT